MASFQCQKTTEKGLGQGFYGGSSSWGSQSNKYQNRYSMSYSEHERHAQTRCPTNGNTDSHTAYEYGTHGNAMSKPHFHGHKDGYMIAETQSYGSNHQTTPGEHHGLGYGYGYEGTNGHGKLTSQRMQHSPPHHGGKLSGHGNGFMKPQTYGGHGGNMTYGMTETEYHSEVYYSKESHYNSGGRGHRAGKGNHLVEGLLGKIKSGFSGKNSCSDSDSDSDDDGHRKRTVCVSKAL